MYYRNNREKELVFDYIIIGITSWIWYKNIFFRCIEGKSLIQSRFLLVCSVFIALLLGLLSAIFVFNKKVSIVGDYILGYGIYTIGAYINVKKEFIMSCLIVTGALSLLLVCYYTFITLKNKRKVRINLYRRIIKIVYVLKENLCFGFFVILLGIGFNMIIGSTILNAKNSMSIDENKDGEQKYLQFEELVYLQDDLWKELSSQEKIDVLQVVANNERNHLGFKNDLNVGAANIPNNTLGYYSDNTHEIIISMDSLLYDSPWELLNTVCHESFHSYQYRIVEAVNSVDDDNKNLMLFNKAKLYLCEFEKYEDGENDFCKYYNQDCETDAREYAELAANNYYNAIMEYIESNRDKKGS